MRKEAILLVLLASTSMLGSAATVNMPGADPSISDKSYNTYVYTNEELEKNYAELKATTVKGMRDNEAIKASLANHTISEEVLERRLDNAGDEIVSLFKTPTDIHIHSQSLERDKSNGIIFTVPTTSLGAVTKAVPDKQVEAYSFQGLKTIYFIEVDNNSYERSHDYMGGKSVLTKDDIRKNFEDSSKQFKQNDFTYNFKTARGATYTYPMMQHSYWDFIKAKEHKEKQDIYISSINFNLSESYMPRYHIGYISTDKDGSFIKDEEKLLANYILPSIHSLSELDTFSRTFQEPEYSHRVFKESNPFGALQKGRKGYGTKLHTGMIQTIEFLPFPENRDVDPYGVLKRAVETKSWKLNSANGVLEQSYRVVWNDAYPGIFMDTHFTDGRELMEFNIYSNKEIIRHRLYIPSSYTGLTNEQLRNFVTDIKITDKSNMKDTETTIDLFGLQKAIEEAELEMKQK